MSGDLTHFRTLYFRPSWQGGDTQQPLCVKPSVGWVGQGWSQADMTSDRSKVTCDLCVYSLATARVSAPSRTAVMKFEIPPRRKNDNLKHCRAVWRASRGMMFPFLVLGVIQARAA